MVKLDKVKWGFIGCGEVTEKKSGPAFALIEGSEVVAVMSRDKEKAQSYAKRHNIPRWYSDPQQLIGDEDVNAIYIATSPLFSCHFCHYVHEGRKARIHRETYGGQL